MAKKPKQTKSTQAKTERTNSKLAKSSRTESLENYIICQKCFTNNPVNTKKCSNCKGDKFAPEYIKRIEKINRNTFVQITLPQDSKEKRITLYKWWPGGRSSYNINNIEQWEKISDIINNKLLEFLEWETKEKIIQEIRQIENSSFEIESPEKQITKLTKAYPDLIRKVLKEIDFTKWEEVNYEEFAEIINEITELLSKTDQGYRAAFREVVAHLPKQQKRAIEDLGNLLKSWSLRQITSISHQVIERLETLNLFKERVLDDATYELRGENSIHRILERAMWIVDERYWLMHSNETLRNIVVKELTENYKEFKDKRPDFVCGSIDNKLIIIELKRPSHELKLEDLNQLENYLAIIENHYDLKTFEAYLVGRKISDDLKKRAKYRGSQFKLRTFVDLIDDTEKRYKEFIKTIEEKDEQ